MAGYAPGTSNMPHVLKRSRPRVRKAVVAPVLILLLTGVVGASGVALERTSVHLSVQLAKALKETIARMRQLAQQVDSLAGVALQNRQAPDLLTSYAGGTCVYLKEECYFYINHTGSIVTPLDTADELITSNENVSGWWASLKARLLQRLWLLVAPLIILLLLLLFGSCILNVLTWFISSHLEAIKLQMVLNAEPCKDLQDLPIYRGPLDLWTSPSCPSLSTSLLSLK